MRYLSISLITATAFSLYGCGIVQLTAGGREVRITEMPVTVKDCRLIGPVDANGSYEWGLFGYIFGDSRAQINVERNLQNYAAELGANTVLLQSSYKQIYSLRMIGEAYACAKVSVP